MKINAQHARKIVGSAAILAVSAIAASGIEFNEASARIEKAKTPDIKAIEVLRCAVAGLKSKEFVELGLAVCAESMKAEDPMTRMYAMRALGAMADKAALPLLMQAVHDESVPVRIETLRAMGVIGNAETVAVLAEACNSVEAGERGTARSSLAKLQGADIEKTILASAQNKDESPEIRAAAMQALADRGVSSSAPALMQIAREDDPETRAAAFQALGALAGPDTAQALLELTQTLKDEMELQEAAAALASIVKRAGTPDAPIDMIASAIQKAGPDVRVALLGALARTGGAKAAGIVEKRALDKTVPKSEKEDELLAIFENLGKADDFDAFKLLGRLIDAMDARTLDDAYLPEAGVAYLSAAIAMSKQHPEEAAAALQKIIQTAEDKKTAKKAEDAMGFVWTPSF